MMYGNSIMIIGWILVLLGSGAMPATAKNLSKCLYIASYHRGNEWQDGIEKGVRSVLNGKCVIRQFNMDTKRNPSPEFCRRKALEAKALIESWQPDIVIASDDNASKYLVEPYYRNKKLPFVFCGINYTAEEYGYPYANATGMIEVPPIMPLLLYIKEIIQGAETGVCIIQDRLSSIKNANRYKNSFNSEGMTLTIVKADTMDDFEKQYRLAQNRDFIIMDGIFAINDWDQPRARSIVLNESKKLTVTMYRAMTAVAMVAMTQVPEEQGEYAAEVALRILKGAKPADIPVVSNRKWNLFLNESLLKKSGIRIPPGILQQAEKVE